jgi:hypothetical protein
MKHLALIVCLTSAPAFAQGTYVGASLTGDVLRSSGSESTGVPEMSQGGEALGFALRVGTPLGSIWGVEAEFSRPAEIDSEWTPRVVPLGQGIQWSSVGGLSPLGGVSVSAIEAQIFSPITYTIQSRQRNTTLSTGVWARQDLSSRISMAYSGGISFNRTEVETEFTFQSIRAPIPGLTIPVRQPAVTKTTSYGARPFVGIETRIAMTEHLYLAPAVRLHGLAGAWLVRPSVGLVWGF